MARLVIASMPSYFSSAFIGLALFCFSSRHSNKIKVGAFLHPYLLSLGLRNSQKLPINDKNSVFGQHSSFFRHRIFTYFSQRFDLNQFDYSSQLGWDRFYNTSNNDTNVLNDEFYEWHQSFSNERIIDQLPLTVSSVVMVGCGTSRLPEQLCRDRSLRGITNMKVVCLDYSKVCIDIMNKYYFGSSTDDNENNVSCLTKNLFYVHGDATQMDKVLRKENLLNQADVILDKGLLDAILCGEGWDIDVERLLYGASQLLSPSGMYILICYKLNTSVKEILVEIGNNVGIHWDFDITTLSSQSISYSIGWKISYQSNKNKKDD